MYSLQLVGRDLDFLLDCVVEAIAENSKVDADLRATWAAIDAVKLGMRDAPHLAIGANEKWDVYVEKSRYRITGQRTRNMVGDYEHTLTVHFDGRA